MRRFPKTIERGAAIAAGLAMTLGTTACNADSSDPTPTKSPTTTEASATPGATATKSPETPDTKGKYDSRITADMSPAQIQEYYQLDPALLGNPEALSTAFTEATEGVTNIGCSKEVWAHYGDELHLPNTVSVGNQIADTYAGAAEVGLYGQKNSTEAAQAVAVACSFTRSLNVDGKERPDPSTKYTIVPNTLKVEKRADGSIATMSWTVDVVTEIDPDIANLAHWDTAIKYTSLQTITNPHKTTGINGTLKIGFDSTSLKQITS